MAFRTKKNASSKAAADKKPARAAAKTQSELRSDDLRAKALKGFHPSVIDWLKDNLNLDLKSKSISVSDIYKLSRREFAGPFDMVVTPKVYDASTKELVDGAPLQVYDSLRINVPFEKGKPVAVDDKHKVFVQTVACRPLVELAAPGEEIAPRSVVKGDEERQATFSEAQLQALEGVGIARDRLYNGFNHLTREQKLEIADGEIFPVEGSVKTDFGLVNVNGKARLLMDGEKASVVFEPTYLEKRTKDLMVDLDGARIIGMMEVDIYERTPDGKRKKDVNGDYILNRAGENLRDFGSSLEPMNARLHKRERGKDGKWNDVYDTVKVCVKVVNNSFYAIPLKENESKELELPDVRFAKDRDGNETDKIYVLGQKEALQVNSPEDAENIRKGFGGLVRDVVYKDKDGKEVKYDAFVQIGESGYAEKFSPASTEEILRRKQKAVTQKAAPARKKVRFGVGL